MIVNTEYKYCTEQSVICHKVQSPYSHRHSLKCQSGKGKTTTRIRNQMVERVVESRRVKVNLLTHAHSPYLLQKLARGSTWSRTVNAGKQQQFNITREHPWTLRVKSICILLIQFFSNVPLSIDMNLLLRYLHKLFMGRIRKQHGLASDWC